MADPVQETLAPEPTGRKPDYGLYVGILFGFISIFFFVLQSNGVEVNWLWSVAIYTVCTIGIVWTTLTHAFPPGKTSIGRYAVAVALVLLCAFLGSIGTVKQYRREHAPRESPQPSPPATQAAPAPSQPSTQPQGKPEKTEHAPTEAHPTKAILPEASVQLVGISVDTGNSNSPLSFQPRLNYQVIGGKVDHVKVLAVAFATNEDIGLPEMTGKLYRAASSLFNPEKIGEVPEMNGDAFSIMPRLTVSSGPSARGAFAIIYAHATWTDRLGISGELTKCFETRIAKEQIDSQTQWSLCEVSALNTFDSKYEAMKSSELQAAVSEMAANLNQEAEQKEQEDEARFSSNSPGDKETFEAERRARLDEYRAEGEHYRNDICPSMEPLIEEIMFRFAYSPYWYIQRPAIEKQSSSQQVDTNKTIQDITMMEQMQIAKTINPCFTPGDFSPTIGTAAATLEMLDKAMTEAVSIGVFPLVAPFNSRLQK